MFLAYRKLPIWASRKAQERPVVCAEPSRGSCSALLSTLNSAAYLEETSEKMGSVSVRVLALQSLLQIPQPQPPNPPTPPHLTRLLVKPELWMQNPEELTTLSKPTLSETALAFPSLTRDQQELRGLGEGSLTTNMGKTSAKLQMTR